MSEQNKSLVEATAEAVEGAVTGKKFWMSKTFWVNVLAGAAMLAQMRVGFVVSPELQAMGLTVVNLMLRKITKEPVTW
jgi:hypothetical protein